jgi:hypothetical protein
MTIMTIMTIMTDVAEIPMYRGDRTPIELFLEGVRVWEVEIRRLLSANAVSED